MTDASNRLRPVPLALSLATFLVIVYLGCLLLALVVPDGGLHQSWLQFLPGFTWTGPGILLGLIESAGYGLFAGLVFAPIYNAFNKAGAVTG